MSQDLDTKGPNKLHRVPRLASKDGKVRFYERPIASPEELYKGCYDYFEWCEENPLYESRPMTVSLGAGMGSEVQMVQVEKARMYTSTGLALHLGISFTTMWAWRDPMSQFHWPEGAQVLEWAETVIREQNITLGAAGLLNTLLVMRVHGIREQMDLKTLDVTPKDEEGVDPKMLSKEERLLLYRAMKRQIDAQNDELLS